MDTTNLVETLDALGINRSDYSIGELKENTLILLLDGRKWTVFFYERGERSGIHTFASENEACEYFLEKIESLTGKYSKGSQ